MRKYTKPEIETLNFEEVDVIATSTANHEQLITWGDMSQKFDSEGVNLFK